MKFLKRQVSEMKKNRYDAFSVSQCMDGNAAKAPIGLQVRVKSIRVGLYFALLKRNSRNLQLKHQTRQSAIKYEAFQPESR